LTGEESALREIEGLTMNGKSVILSNSSPFAVSVIEGSTEVFQQNREVFSDPSPFGRVGVAVIMRLNYAVI
jgi:hypothetical protein